MPETGASTRNLEQYIDYSVLDRDDSKVGDVEAVWEDSSGDPAFLSVRTGWLGFGRAHVVPAQAASVSEQKHAIRLPYTKDVIKNAPSYDSETDIDPNAEREIFNYYRGYGFVGSESERVSDQGAYKPPMADTAAAEPGTPAERTGRAGLGETSGHAEQAEEQTIPLKEEVLHVDKHEENAGVRIRKVVRTETVNQPVELEREELVVERTDVDKPSDQAVGSEEDVFIPLRREVADVHKDTRVHEEVRVGKQKHTDHQDVREEVKKEDVDIDDNQSTRH